MASRKLTLHVGLHKTATSSFQVTCGNNRRELAAQGIHYPLFKISDKQTFNHSIPIFLLFSEHPERYNVSIKWGFSRQVEKVKAQCREQLDAVLATHDEVLLSGEDISVLTPAGLRSLRDYLQMKGFEVRVLCSVRKPYSFTCSEIQQKVRGGALRGLEKIKVPRKSSRIRALQDTFTHTEFFSFEDDLRHPGGPVIPLLERAGVNPTRIEPTSINEGLGNITTRLYAALNAQYPVILRGELNPMGRDKEVINFDQTKFLLTAPEVAAIRNELDAENEAIRALLGDSFADDNYPVSEPVSLDFEMAGHMLVEASRPPHVRDAVERFLLEHSDGSWGQADLAGVELVPQQKAGGRMAAFTGMASAAERLRRFARSATRKFR